MKLPALVILWCKKEKLKTWTHVARVVPPQEFTIYYPQNKILTVQYRTNRTSGNNSTTYTEKVLFVPVMNQPLSMNRYYVVVAKGKHKGEIFTSSREEDMTTCCFGDCINDTKPSPFDHRDIYQQFEIIPHKGRFTAKSVASDGFVPWIFRQKGALFDKTNKSYQLNEALGLNNTLRSHLPKLDGPESCAVGRWYCPFFFVKEERSLKEQMERSIFYEVTLEQFWEQISDRLENKRILFEGKEPMTQDEGSNDGFMWFKKSSGERVGLSVALWERVNWEENRGGWMEENRRMYLEVKFGGSVLVERFLFKRMDGSLVLTLDFMHTNKVITK